jgi:hypothetical protein
VSLGAHPLLYPQRNFSCPNCTEALLREPSVEGPSAGRGPIFFSLSPSTHTPVSVSVHQGVSAGTKLLMPLPAPSKHFSSIFKCVGNKIPTCREQERLLLSYKRVCRVLQHVWTRDSGCSVCGQVTEMHGKTTSRNCTARAQGIQGWEEEGRPGDVCGRHFGDLLVSESSLCFLFPEHTFSDPWYPQLSFGD